MSLLKALKEATRVSIRKHKSKKYGMFCIECEERLVPDEVYVEDVGIGPYEFQGDKRVEIRLVVLHTGCNGNVVDTKTNKFICPDDIR